MYKFIAAVIFIIAIIAILFATGKLTLQYLVVMDEQPISRPTIIKQFSGDALETNDGLKIRVNDANKYFTDKLKLAPGDEIEITQLDENYYLISAREKKTLICGTGWANKISIPIYPVVVYRQKLIQWTTGTQVGLTNHYTGAGHNE